MWRAETEARRRASLFAAWGMTGRLAWRKTEGEVRPLQQRQPSQRGGPGG